MNWTALEEKLNELPLYCCEGFDPRELEFSPRVRHICQNDCPMYGKSWACPPAVGTVEECREKCLSYPRGLMIATVTEVEDITDIESTLATRAEHEEITNRVKELFREEGAEVYALSTEACAVCDRCAYLDGQPCRFPERMHPCVESQGINMIPMAENHGMSFQYGDNVVTWFSLLLYRE